MSENLEEKSVAEPPEELLSRLNARVVARLSGRINRHWVLESLSPSRQERRVVRKWSPQTPESIEYERTLIHRLETMGWPVAPLSEPQEFDDALWSISPFLSGEPRTVRDSAELRARGRLLAELHDATGRIETLEQRPGWRRTEEILSDLGLDQILSLNEPTRPEEVRIVRWHLERARLRIRDLEPESYPSLPIHGDFATWNILFQGDKLSGLLDFELAHNDLRVADFVLSWRGKYDEVVEGYEEVSPLQPEERALIVPVWWAQLIEDACRRMREGTVDDGWTVTKLLTRSPLMGPDAAETP